MQQKRSSRDNTWRQRAFLVAVAIAVCGAAATAAYRAMPGLVSEHRLRAALAVHVGAWVAADLYLPQQNAHVSFKDGPVMTFHNAVLSGNRGGREWRLEAGSTEVTLETVPLLWDRIKIKRLVLDRPRFHFNDSGEVMAHMAETPVDPRYATQKQAGPPHGEIILNDASIVHEGPAGQEGIQVPDLRMAADPGSTAVLLTCDVLVGGRLLRVGGRVDDPAAVLSRRGSNVRLVLRDAQEAENGDTTLPRPPPPDVPTIAEESESMWLLRRMAAAVGLPAYGPIAVEGRFALTPRSFGITDATLTVNGVVMDGDLSVSLNDRKPPFTQMDQLVSEAMAAWKGASTAIRAGDWREAPLALGWLAPLDVSLDAQIRNPGSTPTEIEGGRVQFRASDARARLKMTTDGEMGRFETVLTVNADPNSKNAAAGFTVTGKVDDVVLDKVGRAILGLFPPPLVSPPPLPEGTLDARIDLASKGDTLGELVSALDGSLVVNARDGSLAGADVVLTLEGLKQSREFMSEEDGPLIPSAGRTVFDTIKARADFKPGTARLTALNISGDRYEIDMSGDVDLRSGAVRANGQAVLLDDGVDTDRSNRLINLPFGSGGTLTAPVVAAGVPRTEPEPN